MIGRKRRLFCVASAWFVFLLGLPCVLTRTWESVVDPSAFVTVDLGRNRLVEENDPFLTRTTPPPTAVPTYTVAPSPIPSSPAPTYTQAPVQTRAPTERRTFSPGPTIASAAPSSVPPTLVPTQREQPFICSSSDIQYQVLMFDSYNDGWDGRNLTITWMRNGEQEVLDVGSTMVITNRNEPINRTSTTAESGTESSDVVFEGTLEGGFDSKPLCLRLGICYEASIAGGEWSDEIRWEIKPFNLAENISLKDIEPVATGGAPRTCNFAIPDEISGDSACNNTCSVFAVDQTVLQKAPPIGGGLRAGRPCCRRFRRHPHRRNHTEMF